MARVVLLLVGCWLGHGCTPHAPTEVNEITRYLLREWDSADPTVMSSGLASLDTILAGKKLGPDGMGDDRSLQVYPPHPEDINVTPNPGRDPSLMIGVGVARQSPWPLEDFARLQIDPDQLSIEPSATMYVRTFVDPSDASCFVDGACGTMRTSNLITRANDALALTFPLDKDFRWFTLPDGRRAIAGRSWEPTSTKGDKGEIRQSYAIDIFIAQLSGVTWRWQASFNETETAIATTTDIAVLLIAGGVDGALARADTVVGKRYHGL